ncbi:hypothetical protein QP164_19460 [Sphingomonas sp. LR59]|uniref:hypothetical protein n=1 Tax=Sphingomonas sp. LR59 TaxID=3050232 RepID=UPI002FE05E4D
MYMNTRNLMATLLATSGMAIAVPAFARAQQDVPVSGPSVNAAPSASAADAQQVGPQEAPAPTEEAADIVVTGSSIRGVAPTGSSLVSVTRADIVATGASTTTELLRTVPQLGSFGGVAQTTAKTPPTSSISLPSTASAWATVAAG